MPLGAVKMRLQAMSWQIISGVVDWWADEGLRDLGRCRRALADGRIPNPQRIARGTLDFFRAAFIAQRDPWRLTEVILLEHRDPWRLTDGTLLEAPESPAPVIASWADEATAILRGKPAEQHVVAAKESWGDFCVRVMLNPNALSQLVPEPWSDRFELDGPLLEHDPSILPGLFSCSTDRYEITFDPGREILMSWTAIIDGAVAQRVTLSRLTELGS